VIFFDSHNRSTEETICGIVHKFEEIRSIKLTDACTYSFRFSWKHLLIWKWRWRL